MKEKGAQGEVTAMNFPQFKKQYDAAVANGIDIFVFEGKEVYTPYAKYVVEYMDHKLATTH